MILWQREVKIFGEKQIIKITPLILLVVLAIVLRIPNLFEPYWYGDEAIYLTLGEGIRQGLLLYRDIFDHKPPLIYLLAALSGSLFWFKFALLVSTCTSIVLFWRLANKLFDGLNITLVASIVFTLLTTLPTLEGNIANSELFMLAPTIGAFFLLSDPKNVTVTRTFLAGLLFSVSFLYKIPGVFDFLAIVAFWVYVAKTRISFKRVLSYLGILALGLFIPIFISVVFFWLRGAAGPYLQAAGIININYISRWGSQASEGVGTGFLFRTIVFGGILGVLYLLKKYFSFKVLFLGLWLTFALFAALLSGRPYPHYLIQVVPPFSLMLGVLAFGKLKERFLPIPFLLILAGAVLFYNFSHYQVYPYYSNFLAFVLGQKTKEQYFQSFDRRIPRIYALSEMLISRTARSERVFIWGTAPEVYALSRRLPPVQYVTSFHVGDFGTGEETLKGLSRNKPKYIVIMPEETRILPGFQAFLAENYLYVENIDGAQVWKLRWF